MWLNEKVFAPILPFSRGIPAKQAPITAKNTISLVSMVYIYKSIIRRFLLLKQKERNGKIFFIFFIK